MVVKKSILISSVLLLLLSATGVFALKDNTNDSLHDIEKLEQALPPIQNKKISFFRNSDWCHVIKYNRGNYTNNQSPNCTWNWNDKEKIVTFDKVAEQDFETVKQHLNQPKIYIAEVTFNQTGEVESASLGVDPSDVTPICQVVWSCDRKTYVYQPKHDNVFPETIPGEIWYEPVNEDWYIRWEDWN